MLHEGQQVEVSIEKPAAGGRMIARHRGQVVLVRGAIPGERVTAWIERVERRLAYAVTREVIDASPDRRRSHPDSLCGGSLYSHIAYPRQLAIKADVVRDAFERLAHYPRSLPLDVAPSPERAYRMRARFHVRGPRVGFYREGTHQLCDAGSTGQLRDETISVVDALARELNRVVPGAAISVSVSENMSGDECAAHVELAPDARVPETVLVNALAASKLTGVSTRGPAGHFITAGSPFVRDALSSIAPEAAAHASLRRHAESFFQGNRFLLPALVSAVLDAVPADGEVLDLYAGVGLFSIALAATRQVKVTAVEGDRTSGADLQDNARPLQCLQAIIANVEDYLTRVSGSPPATTLVDPPRTGLSKAAIGAIIQHRSPRIVYVSCDPPTLARDARKLLDAGYRLENIRGFDLFPNTPHVETVSVFLG